MPPAEPEDFHHFRVHRRGDGALWELGRGAMGVTYKAHDTRLRRDVALKVIAHNLLASDTARERFLREARAAAALIHPNVAAVYDLGEDAQNCFYAMEYIEGETLDALVRRIGPLDPVNALRIAAAVAAVLQKAHALRPPLLHRDLKPANVMVALADGELHVKVIDFGIAKFLHDADDPDAAPGLTMQGRFVGTPEFASPEQCMQDENLDGRSDLYSLGVTLWFLLTGAIPFRGANVVLKQINQPPPLENLAAQPPDMVGLLKALLAKDREERPANGAALRAQIGSILRALDPAGTFPTPPAVRPVVEPAPPPPAATVQEFVPSSVPSGPGANLADWLAMRDGRLPAATVGALLIPLAQILDAAGGAALDLRPGNTWIVPVAGTGAPPRHSAAFTDPALLAGAPGRVEVAAAPPGGTGQDGQTLGETFVDRRPAPATPAAALAALAYELLAGRPPAPDRPYAPLSECGEEANRVLQHALAGVPGQFAGAREFARAFRAAQPTPAQHREHAPGAVGTEPPAAAPVPLSGGPPAPARRGGRRWVAWLLAVAAAGLLAAGLWLRPAVPEKRLTPAPTPAPTIPPIQIVAPPPTPAPTPTPTLPSTPTPTPTPTPNARQAQAIVWIKAAQLTAQSISAEYDRPQALADIAAAQARVGDAAGSRQSFEAALRSAGTITDKILGPAALAEIAIAQVMAGDVPAAQQTLQAIENASWRDRPLGWIAFAQARAGDVKAALQSAQAIADNYWKARALRCIAAAQAAAGDAAGSRQSFFAAMQCARNVEGDHAKARVWGNIATAQAVAGDEAGSRQSFAAALRSVQAIRDDYWEAWALAWVAAAQAVAGDAAGSQSNFAAALRSARAVQGDTLQADAMGTIAIAQARTGDVKAARQSAQGIEDDHVNAPVLQAIAIAQAKAGDFAAVETTLELIASSAKRCTGYAAAANALLADPAEPDDD